MSHRRTLGPAARAGATAGPANGEPDLLDAVRESVMAVGVRRTTLTDVARRAGVSRMTVYRRYPDVASLVQALMTREFERGLRHATAEATELASGRERIVETVSRLAELLVGDPLLRRILDVDPELLLPYATERLGAFQRTAVGLLAERIADAQREGSVREGDPATIAAAVELAVRGFVFAARMLSPGPGAAGPPPPDREPTAPATHAPGALAELRAVLDGYLRPPA